MCSRAAPVGCGHLVTWESPPQQEFRGDESGSNVVNELVAASFDCCRDNVAGMETGAATGNPYLAEAFPWACYGVGLVVAANTHWTGREMVYTIFMSLAITLLILAALFGFVRNRSAVGRVAPSAWKVVLFLVGAAAVIVVDHGSVGRIVVAVATIVVIVIRVASVHRYLTGATPGHTG